MGVWTRYFNFRKNSTPHPITNQALALFANKTDLKVLDLGCGTGGDTLLLAKEGCKVTALDAKPMAISITQSRADDEAVHVSTLVAKFENMQLTESYDLVIAHMSLYCVAPELFNEVWSNIVDHINIGGRFAGKFHGDKHAWVKTEPEHTFLSYSQVLNLFNLMFDIEFINAPEPVEKTNPTIGTIVWHEIEVIARKKPSYPEGQFLGKHLFFVAPSLCLQESEEENDLATETYPSTSSSSEIAVASTSNSTNLPK